MKNKVLYFLSCMFLTGCATKLQTEELHLIQNSVGQKIYILSVLPKNSQLSEFAYLSNLFVSTKTERNQQFSAFVDYFPNDSSKVKSSLFFAESIKEFDQTHFPLLFADKKNDSLSHFLLKMTRNHILFSAQNTSHTVDYELTYNKKQKYVNLQTDSLCSISAMADIQTKLSFGNDIDQQESTLFFHTIDSPDFLFRKQDAKRFFWLDFILDNQTNGSLFFSKDEKSGSEVLYKSSKEFHLNKINLELIEFQTGEQILELNYSQKPSNKKFAVTMVELYSNDKIVGRGILYLL